MKSDKALAKSLFTYNEKSGLVRWRVDRVAALTNHKTIKAKAGDVAGWINDSGYRLVMFKGRKCRATDVIWLLVYGRYPKDEVDHKNGNRSDNRIKNLRDATPSQNRCNSKLRSDSTSGFKGVSWYSAKGKWRATIKFMGKHKHLGFFVDPKKASIAYETAAKELHGQFARMK